MLIVTVEGLNLLINRAVHLNVEAYKPAEQSVII